MDRRFLTVLGVSLVFALVVSSIFYQMTARAGGRPKKEKVEQREVVVAARPLPMGVAIKPADVKISKMSADQFPKGAFSRVEEVIDRPVVGNILLDEPVMDGRLGARGAGAGLAPIIPVGMRAVSVRVNEVVGVAGYVLPGMRVDVLVTGRPPKSDDTVTVTVLQNILVLSAGQTIQPEPKGEAITAPVVTLLVTPEQAETLTLAGTEGRIQLVLRNGSDQLSPQTKGRAIAELYGGRRASTTPTEGVARPRVRPHPVAVVVAPPVAPPPPPDEVMVIRGTKKTVEVLGAGGSK
ncbi:MAG: Flp pilus assembly protein CpaB [Acidobacteriales bacterium]|nr:Flp pilus assembly protein CpaB [Terriglobales bacterium]